MNGWSGEWAIEGEQTNEWTTEQVKEWRNKGLKEWRTEGTNEGVEKTSLSQFASLLWDASSRRQLFSEPLHICSLYIFSVSTCIMREVVFTVCLMYNIFSTISGTSGHPVFFWDQCAPETQNGNRSPECSAVNLFLLLHSSCWGSRYTFARHLKTDENIDHGSCNNDSFTRCGCLSGKTV